MVICRRGLLVLGVAMALASAAPLQSRQDEKPRGSLGRVPPDSAAIVHVRVGDFWKAEMFAGFKDLFLKAGEPALKAFDKRFQPPPSGIESLCAYLTPADEDNPPTPGLIVAFLDDFAPTGATKSLLPQGVSLTEFGQKYTADRKLNLAVRALDARTLLIATAEHMPKLIRHEVNDAGPMAAHLKAAAGKPIYAVADLTVIPKEWFEAWGEEVQPLFAAKQVVVTGEVGKELRLSARAAYADATAVAAADKAARQGLAKLRSRTAAMLVDVEKRVMTPPKGETGGLAEMPQTLNDLFRLAALRSLEAFMANPPLTVAGDSLALDWQWDMNDPKTVAYTAGFIAGFAVPATEQLRAASAQTKSQANLMQLAKAMHEYEAEHGDMPSAIRGDNGKKVLLSWRVAILPHLGEDELYRQFKKDQPWDSEHNKKLIARMPAVFADPRQSLTAKADGKTHYQLIVGGGAGFRADRAPTKLADVLDGTSNTIMIVTAADPVGWTQPEDVVYDPNKALPRLGLPGQPILAAFFDGSVRSIDPGVKQRTLRALISRAGGELIADEY